MLFPDWYATTHRIASDVALKIKCIYPLEVARQVLSHPVKGHLVDETVVRDEADDPVSPFKSVGCPAEELDVRVMKLVTFVAARVLRVCVSDAPVNYGVPAVLVVVVFV